MAPAIQVLAMKRSGQHGFIESLIAGRGGRCLHMNNVIDGKPADCHLYDGGQRVRSFCPSSGVGADWSTANIEDADLSRPLPFDCHAILFIRDVYNCMASRLKVGRDMPVARWIQHAKEYLGWTRLVPAHQLTCVRYDIWRDLVKWPHIAKYAWGSSFGDRKVDSVAMDTRWREFASHDQFKSEVLGNEEAGDLNEQIFGWRV